MQLSIKGFFSKCGPYRSLVKMALLALLLMTISRLGLVAWQWTRVSATELSMLELFVQGVRADLIIIGMWLMLPVLLMPLSATPLGVKFDRFVTLWAVIGLVLFLFMEIATPTFIAQYDLRPNRLFIEYLVYPKEVMAMLWNGFRLPLLGGLLLTALGIYAIQRLFKVEFNARHHWSNKWVWLSWPVVVVLVFIAVRSTTEHRPANPAKFALTGDAMVNSLIINSTWSVYYAAYSMKHEAKSSEIYGQMPLTDILATVKTAPWLQDLTFNNEQLPTLHQQTPTITRAKPLNLVIVLEESLGATFVESLGGVPVTPNLERLKQQGWWLERLFATGTRSVRGIEAVTAGYLPTPARSVVKLSKAQTNFFTIATGLKQHNYHTEFVYGGEAHFDNMKGFFTGNGFSNIVDQKDIQNPAFVGSWGASDEDLFNTAHQRLLTLHQSGQPFFSLIFSSSNHEPFEFPDGRIELHEQPKQTVNNAVKYADYALGQFFDKAMAAEYWQDTVFLIVADHDNRVYGDSLVPVKKFHIPGIILGADIEPKTLTTLMSQVDLAPTLYSLIGLPVTHPMIGRDLTKDSQSPGRAMMQFDNYYAWMVDGLDGDNNVTILRANQPALAAHYDFSNGQLKVSEQPARAEQTQKALAHVLLPSILYREQRYREAK